MRGTKLSYEEVILERQGHIGILTLSRPDVLNALNKNLQNETREVCSEIEADDNIRALIVTGSGRGFCAGADLTGGIDSEEPKVPDQNRRLDEFGWVGEQAVSFYRMTKPTIAAVNGIAVGAGMSMALACDLRVGSELTRFKTTFLERSLSPDSGMSFFLPRILGYSRAMDLILTSRMIDSAEAYQLGLLNRLSDSSENLLDEALVFAEEITRWPPMAVRSAKRVTQRNLHVELEQALINETSALNFAQRAPHDVAESRRSWEEKRAPEFTGI
ncbi:MAG TPA: enoyl-CoA hydratase/isomerase family protein [Dehalococcoidia bacterium]|nr:enoyl-CoA hydratase/isomerase family protein [Dehalococcoidia bacterium]